jgi:hypothetical protein
VRWAGNDVATWSIRVATVARFGRRLGLVALRA